MSWPDLVNGSFELMASGAILVSCYKLHKDKRVGGISLVTTSFMASWGVWNLYYYPSLGQWLSFVGGVGVVLANTLWSGMLIYYSRRR